MESADSPLNSKKKYVLWTKEILQACQSSMISCCFFSNSNGHLEGDCKAPIIGSNPMLFPFALYNMD
jgi:hypothetical protein